MDDNNIRLFMDCCENSSVAMELTESSSKGGRTKFRGKFQEADAVNKNKRSYPHSVLDENVRRLQSLIEENKLLGELDHPCLIDKDFEVLTPNGWKKFESIRTGDAVYSRVNGQMVESIVSDVIDRPYDGKAIKVKGNSINCTFTAPHKFLLCRRDDHRTFAGEQYYETIEAIHSDRTKHSHSYIPKTATWEGARHRVVTLPGVQREKIRSCERSINIDAMKFAGFLGIYLAEGHLCTSKSSNRVMISQKSEYGRKLVAELLKDFHPEIQWKECKTGFYAHDARLYDYLAPLGNKYHKYIPAEIKQMSSEVLERLVTAFAIGDGRILASDDQGKTCRNIKECEEAIRLDNGKYTRLAVFSVSEQLVDDLHECVVKCGMSGSRYVIVDTKDYVYAGRIIKASSKKPLHVLSLSRTKGIHMDPRFLETTETRHQGRIYCLTTEYGNFYMRYKGKSFWTGNCDSIVHLTNASHKITKLWWEGNILMGEGEALSTPHGKVLSALLADGAVFGISSRGVGSGKLNENGILVIGENYKLITFDAVADPSTINAYQKQVSKSSESVFFPEKIALPKKNEGKCIHNINENQLIALFQCIVDSKTQDIKARVNH